MSNANHPVSLVSGIVVLGLLAILILGAPFLAPYDPVKQNVTERLEKPSMEHPLGTDRFGRDVLSRTLHGGQTTLISSVVALCAALIIGLFVGLTAGMFHGSIIDIILMRLIDVLLSFPFMVLAMVIAALFGTSLSHLLLAVVAVWWVSFARLTRSVVLHAKNETSFAAARVLGATNGAIIFKELLPKAISPVLILATFELGSLILSIAALSFLGLGSQPPAPEWGSMLADGRDHFMQAPHILIGPALFIFLTVLAFNLIGEGLRDRLDPYEKTEL
ncbi:Glutathione transport system permease protein GsiD [Paenibacillus plantiphilus]|uniref:Glutathione transport system permease protein GsiD n=1 Tax=Paenibacillus plantiphilus TaxID=2905650 RepID=A0ABM9BX80_9BACL|nr:ABC transporter permease [Paenibacillus plantiphilus]CAH1195319.1 Glutathione transport system permease protein GsiD [Paenibacillus plantiphilus]